MAEKKAKPAGDARRWFVVHQHHQVDVVHSNERPETKVAKGERAKVIHGPYATEEEARTRADWIYSRTTKARLERAG
jgi:hypothetical protein